MADPPDRSSEDLLREAKRALESPRTNPEDAYTIDSFDQDAATPKTTGEPWTPPQPTTPAATEPRPPRTSAPPEGRRTESTAPERPRRAAPDPRPPRTPSGERLLVSVPVRTAGNQAVAAIAPLLLGLGIAAFFAFSAGGVAGGFIIGLFLLVSAFRLLRRLARNRDSSSADVPTQVAVTTERVVLTRTGIQGGGDVRRAVPIASLREWELRGGRLPSIELEFDDGTEVTLFMTPNDARAVQGALRTVAPDAED